MLSELDRRILMPLLKGPRTLTQEGEARMKDLCMRGLVRLSPARCGPLAVVTGELMAILTEAGRAALHLR
jgi:hypothetical protein